MEGDGPATRPAKVPGRGPTKKKVTGGGWPRSRNRIPGRMPVDFRAAAQGRGIHRAGRGRRQPAVRLGGHARHRDRGRDVAVPSLRGLRDRSDAGAALHPRRLRAGAGLPAVSGGAALPRPHPLVGRARGPDLCRHSRSTPSSAARISPTAPRCRTAPTSFSASSSSRCWSRRRAAPSARSCRSSRSCSSPMRWPDPICRRPGTIAAMASTRWSGISSLRWKAFSAFRSMCRRR